MSESLSKVVSLSMNSNVEMDTKSLTSFPV